MILPISKVVGTSSVTVLCDVEGWGLDLGYHALLERCRLESCTLSGVLWHEGAEWRALVKEDGILLWPSGEEDPPRQGTILRLITRTAVIAAV